MSSIHKGDIGSPFENNNTSSETSKTTDDDGRGLETRSQSNSSFTDSLDAEDVSEGGCDSSNKISIGPSRPSRLPVMKAKSKPYIAKETPQDFLDCVTFETPKSSKFSNSELSLNCIECLPFQSGTLTPAKETITSRLRFEKRHFDHDHENEAAEYLTPTQRKGQTIKDLKRQVRELTKLIGERDIEIDNLTKKLDEETERLLEASKSEMVDIREQLDTKTRKYEDLTKSYEESVKAVNALEVTVKDLKEAMAAKEQQHEAMYLEMYKKGQESAKFERDDELEMLAKGGKGHVSTKELVLKLSSTQSELAKWQSLKREEVYGEAGKPETEAETTLRFLKDSFFHYLTDLKDSEDHLRAMTRIFNYSEVQRKKIIKAKQEKKRSRADKWK